MTDIIDSYIRHPGSAVAAAQLAPYFRKMGPKLKTDYAGMHNALFIRAEDLLKEKNASLAKFLEDEGRLDHVEIQACVTQMENSKTIRSVLATDAAGFVERMSYQEMAERVEPLRRFLDRQDRRCPLLSVLLILAQICESLTETGISALPTRLKFFSNTHSASAAAAMLRTMLGVEETEVTGLRDLEAVDINPARAWQDLAPQHSADENLRFAHLLDLALTVPDVLSEVPEAEAVMLRCAKVYSRQDYSTMRHHLQPLHSLAIYGLEHSDEIRRLSKPAEEGATIDRLDIMMDFESAMTSLDLNAKAKLVNAMCLLFAFVGLTVRVEASVQTLLIQAMVRHGRTESEWNEAWPYFGNWLVKTSMKGNEYCDGLVKASLTLNQREQTRLSEVLAGWTDDEED